MFFIIDRYSGDLRLLLTVFLALCIAFIVGIAFHEFSHALTAYALGDRTAQSQGRLTLNPLAHLDPFGTMLLLLAGFGWGKPTPVNPYKLKNGPTAGMVLVSAAGPISNFLMAFLFSLPLKLAHLTLYNPDVVPLRFWSFGSYLAFLFFTVIVINVLLGLFNLIPIAPLDGSKIAAGIFPGEIGYFFRRIEPYGPGILMVLFALSWFSPSLSIFSRIIYPMQDRIMRALGVG